ncbi:hypothetical protein [Streptomyces sp. NBC_00094]|uniref:hypothetical protein n=1 Tax=Streptomyces sp. NBC_00094 TaxID=2903620 RepID=UPI00225BFA16|nr:hypothetical protein [Streptomyces sp. NBC_00094]MCX5389360.1 hypothetical protein [Streptomyces sp. NBC_00094]
MLTKYDELLCHQNTTTFDHVNQSDLRWTERVVMYGFDTSKEGGEGLNFMTGMARYPNRNVLDAYGMVTVGDKNAHVVRMSGELQPETGALASNTVGPFTYEIVEPLKKIRASLAENEHGVSFQLDFDAAFPAYEQAPAFFRSRGRVLEDARRFYQNGRLSGWIKTGNQEYEIDPATWRVGRDHSWGVRRGGGGGSVPEGRFLQPAEHRDGGMYFMGIFDFGDRLVHFAQRETSSGQRYHFEGDVHPALGGAGDALPVLSVEHDFRFRDGGRLVDSGVVGVTTADGVTRSITLRAMTDFWPGLAGYDHYRDYMSGMWKGASFIDGFTADVTDPTVRERVSMLTETLCEVECDGRIGYGLLEMVCVGNYPRYGFRAGSAGRA